MRQIIGMVITALLMTVSLIILVSIIKGTISFNIDEVKFQTLLFISNGIYGAIALFFLGRWFWITNKNLDLLLELSNTRKKFSKYLGIFIIIAILTIITVWVIFAASGVSEWNFNTVALIIAFPLIGILLFPVLFMILFTSNNFKYVVQFWKVRKEKT